MDELTRVVDADAEGNADSYDLVPYQSLPFSATHPTHLSAIATIFGIDPPAVESSRILELGCASGGNIIPLAAYMPRCQVIGVDLSSRQIEEGKKIITNVGLKNIELRCQSIEDINTDMGKFDYIIAHGVYSWVSESVRNKIVAVCKENLNDNGIAYISYNTYPGWHMPQALREMMLYHTAAIKDPKKSVTQARAFLRFLFEATKSADNPYSAFLKTEVDFLEKKGDYYIYHEYLEKNNFPVYFYQLAESARRQGLSYLADAEVATMLAQAFPENVAKALRTAPNILQQEQYMDFLRNRRFRRSLFCHEAQKLDRTLKGESLKSLYVAAAAFPKDKSAPQPDADSKLTLVLAPNREVKIAFPPLLQKVMPLLWKAWPRAIPFAELAEAAKKSLPKADASVVNKQLGASLFRLYFGRIVAFHGYAPPLVSKAGSMPKVPELMRCQAKTAGTITNLWHNQIRLGQVDAKLVSLLDGTKDKTAIAKEMEKAILSAREAAIAKGHKVAEQPPTSERLAQEVERSLERLARASLLIA